MRVLGIDPGIAITGYGVVEGDGDRVSLLACGVITTEAGRALPDRLLDVFHDLNDLVDHWQPDSSAVEELFFSKNVRTALSVGHARGVALLSLANAGIPVSEYKPAEVKEAVTGYGAAPKRQVQMMVQQLLGLADIPRPDDAADAVAVALCHLHSARWQALVGRSSG